MIKHIIHLLYPPKCVLCQNLLSDRETDLCCNCRKDAQEFTFSKKNISFVAGWTAVWYYNEQVKKSLHRFKFYNGRSNANAYGRLLAMRLMNEGMTDYDILTWVPLSGWRRFRRGYDQCRLLADAVAKELGCAAVSTLRKDKHRPPQSITHGVAARRANVLGAYKVKNPSMIAGKRILLLDDIITTGATVSECAKTLLLAGAKEVKCAAVAATDKE